MKKVILTISLFVVLCFMANNASAKIVFLYSNGEKVDLVEKLPEDAMLDNEHVNLGVMYSQFSMFWLPLWNYGETKYVLINDRKNTYFDLSAEDLEILKSDYNIDIPENYTIGFWDRVGGKLCLCALIIVIAILGIRSRSDNKTETQE
jgi:hypothetical protein